MPTYAVVTADTLNLRAGPSLAASILRVLPRGAVVEVLQDAGFDWMRVRLDDGPNAGQEGYVSKVYLQFSPTRPGGAPTPTPAPRRGEVAARLLNLRGGPGTGFPILDQLGQGTTLDVFDTQNGWYRVHVVGRMDRAGWVASQYVRLLTGFTLEGFLIEEPELVNAALTPSRMLPPGAAGTNEGVVTNIWNRFGGLLNLLSDLLRIPSGGIVAVLAAESNGEPFGRDGRMIIRFENHIFWRYWGVNNTEMFDAHFTFDRSAPSRHWRGHQWRPTASGPFREFHGDQMAEWMVFDFARRLDESAAMLSISMGAPQIMGFNFTRLGYESVQAMFSRFSTSVHAQLLGIFDFVKGPGATSPAITALQAGDYLTFASIYNGSANALIYNDRIRLYKGIFDRLIGV